MPQEAKTGYDRRIIDKTPLDLSNLLWLSRTRKRPADLSVPAPHIPQQGLTVHTLNFDQDEYDYLNCELLNKHGPIHWFDTVGMNPSYKSKKETSMSSQPHLTVCEYHPCFRERALSLFTAGMADNKANAEDEHTRARVDVLVNRVISQFENLEAFLHSKNGGKLFLAKTSSEHIVGMFAVLRSDENMRNEEVEFSRISVASTWRRKGVCRLLHDHAVRYSRDVLGAKTAYLITLSSVDPGMRAYKALGFREGFDNILDHRGFDVEVNAPVLVKFWKPLL